MLLVIEIAFMLMPAVFLIVNNQVFVHKLDFSCCYQRCFACHHTISNEGVLNYKLSGGLLIFGDMRYVLTYI